MLTKPKSAGIKVIAQKNWNSNDYASLYLFFQSIVLLVFPAITSQIGYAIARARKRLGMTKR